MGTHSLVHTLSLQYLEVLFVFQQVIKEFQGCSIESCNEINSSVAGVFIGCQTKFLHKFLIIGLSGGIRYALIYWVKRYIPQGMMWNFIHMLAGFQKHSCQLTAGKLLLSPLNLSWMMDRCVGGCLIWPECSDKEKSLCACQQSDSSCLALACSVH